MCKIVRFIIMGIIIIGVVILGIVGVIYYVDYNGETPTFVSSKQILSDFTSWQNYLSDYAKKRKIVMDTDEQGIDLKQGIVDVNSSYILNTFILDNGWEMTVELDVTASSEYFEIILSNKDFSEYSEDNLIQMVQLFNELSPNSFSENQMVDYVNQYKSERTIDEHESFIMHMYMYGLNQKTNEKTNRHDAEISMSDLLRTPAGVNKDEK